MLEVIARGFYSALVIAGATVAVVHGASVAAFDHEREVIEIARSGKAPVEQLGFWRRPPDIKPRLVEWAAHVGTATLARRMIVNEPDQPSNVAARLVDAARALEVEPTSGRLWLSYADLAWQMRMPPDRIWPATEMALLTGRREAEISLGAATQTVTYWDRAPENLHVAAAGAIGQLSAVIGHGGRKKAREFLASQPAEVRRAFSARLITAVNVRDWALKELGLWEFRR